MTEYEEITIGKTVEELEIELKFQIETLGYNKGDSFPSYLQELINLKKS